MAPRLRLGAILALLHSLSGKADKTCPEPWKPSQCLGTSGDPAGGTPVDYKASDDSVQWKEGMSGHSHYGIDAGRTALFVIDPQKVYSECPKAGPPFKVPDLISSPGSEGFDGHSPLCCEKFSSAVGNANRLAARSRELGIPVYAIAHIYRDFTGDGEVDNCGRICDFDPLGWTGWPKAFNLWNEAFPWHAMVYKEDGGFDVDFTRDFYTEKSVYTSFTKPVVEHLRARGVDTVIISGFMTQYCCVTSSRHGSDLGFRIIFASDACDGPVLAELLSGVDENHIVPFHLGISVADITTTDEILAQLATATPRTEL